MTGVGIFIAFEGGDGAGKSTQVALLADAFEHVGREVVRTRQPGGTDLGAQIRELLLHGDVQPDCPSNSSGFFRLKAR